MSALGCALGATRIAGAVHTSPRGGRSHRSARNGCRRASRTHEPTIRWVRRIPIGQRRGTKTWASIGGWGVSFDLTDMIFGGKKKKKRTDADDSDGDGREGTGGDERGGVMDPAKEKIDVDANEPAPSPPPTGGDGGGDDAGGNGGGGNDDGDSGWSGWDDDDASGGGSPGGGAAPFLLMLGIAVPTAAAACARWADANPDEELPFLPAVKSALAAMPAAVLAILDGVSTTGDDEDESTVDATATLSVVVPALNEEATMTSLLTHLASLDPPPAEVIVSVGDSTDDTASIAESFGAIVVRGNGPGSRGRSRQMNAGALRATGDLLLFLHADTQVPSDAVNVARRQLCSGAKTARTVLGGFVSLITVPEKDKTYWFLSMHNVAKTFYTVAVFRPKSFVCGLKCLFGDQAMFCRAKDFEYVGGFDENLPIMEDADLCVRMHVAGPRPELPEDWTDQSDAAAWRPPRLQSPGKWIDNGAAPVGHDETRDGTFERFVKRDVEPSVDWFRRGRVVLVNRVVTTSGRRIEDMGGNFKATFVHFMIGFSWYLGASPEKMVEIYHKYYSDVR